MTAIHQEVQERFGLVPNFFRLAPESPEITADLWGFARFGYLDNPLPSLFKERLFVWLSRFCEVRYCIARHVGFLVGLGRVAGDASCPPQPVDDIMRLLNRPLPREVALSAHIQRCAALEQPLGELPAPGSDLEWSIFACATHLFLQTPNERECHGALNHALGSSRMEHLLVLLAFVRTAHYWTRGHPELTFEEDIEQLLATHRQLSECLLNDAEVKSRDMGQRLLAEVDSLRQEKQQLVRENEMRIQQELADSRLLHDISNELMGQHDGHELCAKIVDAASRLMRSQFASMQELRAAENGGAELLLLGHRGFTAEAAEFWERVRIDSASSCGVALARGQRIVVPDVERCEFMAGTEDLATYLGTGIRAVQTTPLYSRTGALVGAISTHWAYPHQPSEHGLELFDVLARQAADLIERSKVEEALRESEARFRALADASPALIWQIDPQGNAVYLNQRYLAVTGLTPEQLLAAGWHSIVHPEDLPDYLSVVDTALRQRTSFQSRVRAKVKDGSWHWFEAYAAPWLSSLGEYRGHVGIWINVTEAVKAEGALRENARRKDEFIATLAHELRNPLAPIANAVILLKRTAQRGPAGKLIDMIERHVDHIVRLVDDLLEVSRITRGRVELRKAAVDLDDILHSAVETSKSLIDRARHQLTVSLPAEPLILEADRVRLIQVVGNLLNNAAKYTDEGGHIWLTAHRDGGQAVVSVRDTGIGIPADMLAQIFEMFSQVHHSASQAEGGLGIGLTMGRSLVEMHGGTIEARSEGAGRGSEFIVRLPLLANLPEPMAGTRPLEEGTSISLAGQRILVVDDNQDAADSMALLLADAGADTQVAYDGAAALAALESYHPHAALIDIGMPGMDGHALAEHIRRHLGLAEIRLIALTGWGQESDRIRSRRSGFDHHLTKPVDIEALKGFLAMR